MYFTVVILNIISYIECHIRYNIIIRYYKLIIIREYKKLNNLFYNEYSLYA